MNEKLPFWAFHIGIPLRKSSKTIPATWDLLGERPFRRPSPVPSSGRPRRRTVPRRPALPSKSQGAGMVLDDSLSGIPIYERPPNTFFLENINEKYKK